MKEIKLANDRGTVLVDNEDYKMLSKYKWYINNKMYILTNIKTNEKWKSKFIHTFIMDTPKGMEVDHIDRNKFNNQKNNLRIVNHSQNHMNISKQINGTSIYKGVSWFKNRNKWRATIVKDRKQTHLGLFKNEEDAALAYNKAAKKMFKEYAYLNEV